MADLENDLAGQASIFDQMLDTGTDTDIVEEPVPDGSAYFGKGELAQIQAPSDETEVSV